MELGLRAPFFRVRIRIRKSSVYNYIIQFLLRESLISAISVLTLKYIPGQIPADFRHLLNFPVIFLARPAALTFIFANSGALL